MALSCLIRNEPSKALELLENISNVSDFPNLNVFNNLIDEFVEKIDVQSCERG